MIQIGVTYPKRRVLIHRPGFKKPLKFEIQYFSSLTMNTFVDKCTYVLTPEEKKTRQTAKDLNKEEKKIEKVTNWFDVDKMLIDHMIRDWDKKQILDKDGGPAELTIENKVGFALTAADVITKIRELAEDELTFKECGTELIVKNLNGQS